MTTQRWKVRALSVERLETRQVMAGQVTAVLEGEKLVILGDDAANGLTLTYISTTQTYRVSGRDAGGSPTSINGQDPLTTDNRADFQGVKQVAVGLAGGDDSLEVGSPAAVDTVIQQYLWIGMGDGNDEVVLGSAGNSAGGAAPVATSLRVGTSLHVLLGAGNDQLDIANADIGLALNIHGEEGNDNVNFATEFTPTNATEPTFFPVRVRGSAMINLGGGEDELKMCHAIVQGNLRIIDGAGIAHLDLYNLNIIQKLDIDTAGEGDEIAIDYVHAKKFTLDTNGGVDDVDITNCRFKTMIVKLGDARDQLLLRNVRVSLLTRLDGGAAGSALVRGPGNQLRGLTRRNIG